MFLILIPHCLIGSEKMLLNVIAWMADLLILVGSEMHVRKARAERNGLILLCLLLRIV